MNRLDRLLLLAAPLALAACATAGGHPLPMSTPAGEKPAEFRSTGEFRSSIGKSAAFDDWRVVGPRINLTRNPDGSWDGTAGPKMTGFHLDVEPGQVHGPNLVLGIQRTGAGVVEVGGIFLGDRFLIKLTSKKLQGTTEGGRCSFDLDRASPALYVGDLACGKQVTGVSIELLGQAARVEDPVLPQAALALLAVMP